MFNNVVHRGGGTPGDCARLRTAITVNPIIAWIQLVHL
jgi:hypothetical protein